ncbi:MAG: amidohydrolase [Bacteroidota bacterium]
MKRTTLWLVAALLISSLPVWGQAPPAADLKKAVDDMSAQIDEKVIAWRRDIHEHPELSNREFKTAEKVAAHLRSLGLEVQTGIAHTGVVGILRCANPGPVIGMRADMDALPVVERVDIPFASKETSTYLGQEVGVMHACGHDTHVAMLMGAAEILTSMKDQLSGTYKFVFQPAEEGAPPGEEGGAKLMVKEGVLKNPDVEVMFGLHVNSLLEVNKLRFKSGGTMAAADRFTIKVTGSQTHGAYPWNGVDPIVVSSQIVMGLQTIVSRQMELTKEAAVVTVGKIDGGVRNNIIPESVQMIGTIRTLDTEMQKDIHERIKRTATLIAESAGAKAEVEIHIGTPVTYNDPELTAAMLPTMQEVAGKRNLINSNPVTGAEDFAFYAKEVPSLFLFVGGRPASTPVEEAAPHHTPDFFIDDSGLRLGVRTLCYLGIDYSTKVSK